MIIGIINVATTGFLNSGGKIVEIGIALLDTDTGLVEEGYSAICKDPRLTRADRNAWIFDNSDLTIDCVRKGLPLSELKEEIDSVLSACDAVTAYNKSFHLDFLRSYGFKFRREWPCPMIVATDLCKIGPTRGFGITKEYKYPRMEEVWGYFFPDKPCDLTHRPLHDVMLQGEVVFKLFELGLIQ